MSTPISPNRPELDFTAHRLTLTDKERQLLATKRWDAKEKQQIAELFDPFKKAFVHYCVRNRQARYHHYAFSEALHFCGKLLLAFDCTYWGFEWERLRAWKSEMLERERIARRFGTGIKKMSGTLSLQRFSFLESYPTAKKSIRPFTAFSRRNGSEKIGHAKSANVL
ncbi:MAG: hypothetical protein IPQ00_02845 [Chloracidobacterium sp.]|nr:hypothetical protein [Chloracidobacterium sp.]